MDPVTAFQLAAGVVGVVDFGVRLLYDTREIYQRGQTVRNAKLLEFPNNLAECSARLQRKLKTSQGSSTQFAALLSLTQRCRKASEELKKAVNDLGKGSDGRSNHPTKAVGAVGSAIKAAWKSSDIDRLAADLKEIQSQMTFAILVHIL